MNFKLKLFILLFLLNINTAFSAIYVTYKCHDIDCMEGTLIDYSVAVRNNLNKTIEIDRVYLWNLPDDSILAFDIREIVKLEVNDVYLFNFTREIKAADYGFTYYFVPCFDVRREDEVGQMITSEVCDDLIKTLTILPLSAIECNENSECNNKEFCSSHRCVNVYCENGVVVDHECRELNCNFFQKIGKTGCVFDNTKTGITLFVVAIFLLVLFFYKKKK